MKLIISNDLTFINPNEELRDYCKKNLVIKNPDYETAKRLGKYLGNIPKSIYLYVDNYDKIILPFGCVKDVFKYCQNNYELKFNVLRDFYLEGNINLYGYQKNAKNRLKSAKNGVLEAPCGSGKTQIGLQLIKEIGGRALWLTHTEKLLNQSYERAKLYFKGDFGFITKGEVKIGRDITFATVQTMARLDTNVYRDAFDVVVVDECHHCVGSPTMMMQFYKVVTNCNCRYKYGLSATLERSDGMIASLFAIIGPKVAVITKEEVGNKIIKAKYVPVKIELDYPLVDYLEFDGSLNFTKLINMLSYDQDRNRIIIDNVKKQKGKQLLLCHRVEQVIYLAKELNGSAIYGSSKERDYDNDIIVATYSLAKEGLDIPDLQVLHLVTPQKQRGIIQQCAGRVERNFEGKEQPLIFDYYDDKIPYCKNCQVIRRRILK